MSDINVDIPDFDTFRELYLDYRIQDGSAASILEARQMAHAYSLLADTKNTAAANTYVYEINTIISEKEIIVTMRKG